MKMHNPPHPGEVLKELCLTSLGLSVDEVAGGVGVSPEDLSGVLNCSLAVSPEMAIRLAKAFGEVLKAGFVIKWNMIYGT